MTEHNITRLGHLGDGIADGPVFAPRTLPGERVAGRLAEGKLADVRILTPSDARVKAPCRHYKGCGGCDLQHAADAFVAEWKQTYVQQALNDQGIESQFRPIHTSPPNSRRRATFAARRTKGGALAGFHARRSDVVVSVPDCHVLRPEIAGFLPVAEQLAQIGASRKQPLSVAVTQSDEGLDVLVRDGKPLDGPLMQTLGQIAQTANLARLTWEDEVIVTCVQPYQTFDDVRVVPPPGAFLQATQDGEQALVSGVIEAIGVATRVVDLFAGCGTFALPLTRTAAVHAVEGQGDMLDAALNGWRMTSGRRTLSIESRDLFRNPLMADDLQGYEAAVIDPPRAGAQAQTAQLAASDVPVIGFVSCNPVTFARDARTLVDAGFGLEWVQVVDQFRWSMHTELVACFKR
ncbi:MAG: class I SAM-dependent RNA methyltransferase [Paracoccaceae bacterium]